MKQAVTCQVVNDVYLQSLWRVDCSRYTAGAPYIFTLYRWNPQQVLSSGGNSPPLGLGIMGLLRPVGDLIAWVGSWEGMVEWTCCDCFRWKCRKCAELRATGVYLLSLKFI